MAFDIHDRWNTPGSTEYIPELPIDIIITALGDEKKRGYWLAYSERDGNICLVSNNNQADHLYIDEDEDGTAQIHWTDETTEFSYDPVTSTIRVERYS